MATRPLHFVLCALLWGCGDNPAAPGPDAAAPDAAAPDAAVDAAVATWPFALPPNFPVPRLPPNRVLNMELAELGRHLFYDKRLSANQTQACASCHLQAKAFTDGLVTPVGSTGMVLTRNASTLTNAVYNPTQTWANPLMTSFELQALIPIEATHPIELGVTGHETEVFARFVADPVYQRLFAAAFPGDPAPVRTGNIVLAISAFERRLISGNSRVDQFRNGNVGALTEAERRGANLFVTERLECHHCHGGFNFTEAVDYATLPEVTPRFFNTGLYNVGGSGDYPDQGLYEFTRDPADRGRFRPPTLRNIAVTAPYMHDGSIATLDEVIRFYERGGRLVESGPNAGDGRTNPNKHSFVAGFEHGTDSMQEIVGDFHGVLICDQAAAHGALAKRSDQVELAGCWAHVIRRFKEAAENFPAANEAVALIRSLYDIDATLDDDRAALDLLPHDDAQVLTFLQRRAGLRNLASREACGQLQRWLVEHRGPTSLAIHNAVEYTLKYWDRFTLFLDNPHIPLDNNATERAFRTAVVGRKNYYGAKSRSGTAVAATMFTLIETCKLNRIAVLPYLRAACVAANNGETLLPWDFKPAA